MRLGLSLLSQGLDVESSKDLFQYYRNRYFGYKPENTTYPCILDPAPSGGNPSPRIALKYFKLGENDTMIVDWKDLAHKQFLFGAPSLGNVSHGPSYCFVQGIGYRESIKGLGMGRMKFCVPNHEFVIGRYAASKEVKLINAIQNGRYFTYPDEAELVYGIYNKTYYGWREAIQVLEQGLRLGCQLSKQVGLFLEDEEEHILLSYKNFKCVGRLRDENYLEVLKGYTYLIPVLEHILYQLNQRLEITQEK